MAYNGAGLFARLYNFVSDRNAAIKIRADRMDAEMDGFADGLSNCITRDGQSTITDDIPFNNKKITGLADATAANDAINLQIAQKLGGYRNLIINAGFRVNQRAFAGGALSSGVFGHDRWKAGSGGGNYSVSAGVATIASGTVVQVIDGLSIETTGTYVINWVGTATLTVDGVSRAKGATFTLTRGTDCTIEIASGTLSELQVEFGSLPSVFEKRPAQIEFALCEYFYRLVPVSMRMGAGSVSIFQVPLTWSMRATPIPAVVSSGSASNVSTSAVSAASRSGGNFSMTSAGAGDTYVLGAVYSLSAEL